MVESDKLRYTKIALNNGSGAMPALGFGTLIPDPVATRTATKAALEAGFRLLDTAERYRTEKQVGDAMQEVFKRGRFSGRMCSSPRSSGVTITVSCGLFCGLITYQHEKILILVGKKQQIGSKVDSNY